MITTRTTNKPLWTLVALSVTVLPFFTSCANLPVANYAEDKSDPCLAERQGLAAHKDYFVNDIVATAAKGAAIGFATGFLGKLAAGGETKDALKSGAVGAGVGAVAGGIMGYYSALQSQKGEPPSGFFENLVKDVDEENRRVQAMNDSFDQLVACRSNQLSEIRTAYNDKQIDRPTGQLRIADFHRRIQDDLLVANDIRKGLGDRADKLKYVIDKAESADTSSNDQDQNDDQDEDQSDDDSAANSIDTSGEFQVSYQAQNEAGAYLSVYYPDASAGQLQYVKAKAKHSKKCGKKPGHKCKKGKGKHKGHGQKSQLAQSHDLFQNQYDHCEKTWSKLAALKNAPLEGGKFEQGAVRHASNRLTV